MENFPVNRLRVQHFVGLGEYSNCKHTMVKPVAQTITSKGNVSPARKHQIKILHDIQKKSLPALVMMPSSTMASRSLDRNVILGRWRAAR